MATQTGRVLVVHRQTGRAFVDRSHEIALSGFAFAKIDEEAVQLSDPVFHGILRLMDCLAPNTVWIYSKAYSSENQARLIPLPVSP